MCVCVCVCVVCVCLYVCVCVCVCGVCVCVCVVGVWGCKLGGGGSCVWGGEGEEIGPGSRAVTSHLMVGHSVTYSLTQGGTCGPP